MSRVELAPEYYDAKSVFEDAEVMLDAVGRMFEEVRADFMRMNQFPEEESEFDAERLIEVDTYEGSRYVSIAETAQHIGVHISSWFIGESDQQMPALTVINRGAYVDYLDEVVAAPSNDHLPAAATIHKFVVMSLHAYIIDTLTEDIAEENRVLIEAHQLSLLDVLNHEITDEIRNHGEEVMDIEVYRTALETNANMAAVHDMITMGYRVDLETSAFLFADTFRWLFDIHLYQHWEDAHARLMRLQVEDPNMSRYFVPSMLKVFDDSVRACDSFGSNEGFQRIKEELLIIEQDFIQPLRQLHVQ